METTPAVLDSPSETCVAGAIERLYRAEAGFVWHTARALGVQGPDLDDVVQEVFVVLVRRYREFEGRSSERTFIYGIVRRVASRHRRSVFRRDRRRSAVRTQPRVAMGEADVATGYLKGRLDEFLNRLPEPQREIFVLSELQQMRGSEIARMLGVNQNTVYGRLRGARRAFDETFGDEGAAMLHEAPADRARLERVKGRVMAALAPVVRSSSAPTAVGVFSSLKLQAAGWVLAVGATSVAAVVVVQSPSETPTVVGAFHSPERSEPKSRTRAAEPTGSHVEAPDAPSSTPGVDDGPDELEQTGASPAIPARRSKRTPSPAAVETAPELELEPEPQPSPEPTASSIASEVDLLKRSRRALRRRAYGRALALLDEHARRFPHGVLRVDRIASRVEAYCGLDRVAEAKRHAARLVDQAPRNLALIDRVEATCAGAPSSVAQPRIAGAAIVRSRGP